jgi:hypothetical protein
MPAEQPMPSASDDPLLAFQWRPEPEAAELVDDLVSRSLLRCPAAALLAGRLRELTGTRIGDWLDHLGFGAGSGVLEQLIAAGFIIHGRSGGGCSYRQHGGLFPTICLDAAERPSRLAIAVESLSDHLAASALAVPIEGGPGARVRLARLAGGNAAELWAVERHGESGFAGGSASAAEVEAASRHYRSFRLRRRDYQDDASAFAELGLLVGNAIGDCGRDLSCDLFFAAERDFWLTRNRAGRIQKARQDAFGLGLANHDHHTYRSSRRWFAPLIAVLERLGLQPRERFYPGGEAGWGAQVLEQPVTGVVVFADVDMSPEELRQDFAHRPFAEGARPRALGTVGLWCALHGESLFSAGMHHLACKVDIALSSAQLAKDRVVSMKRFSDLPHLRQCFTEGEQWPVAGPRIARLLGDGLITSEQASRFGSEGALGSHLELVERNAGFKGFNQHGVDEIISGTDPRRAARP